MSLNQQMDKYNMDIITAADPGIHLDTINTGGGKTYAAIKAAVHFLINNINPTFEYKFVYLTINRALVKDKHKKLKDILGYQFDKFNEKECCVLYSINDSLAEAYKTFNDPAIRKSEIFNALNFDKEILDTLLFAYQNYKNINDINTSSTSVPSKNQKELLLENAKEQERIWRNSIRSLLAKEAMDLFNTTLDNSQYQPFIKYLKEELGKTDKYIIDCVNYIEIFRNSSNPKKERRTHTQKEYISIFKEYSNITFFNIKRALLFDKQSLSPEYDIDLYKEKYKYVYKIYPSAGLLEKRFLFLNINKFLNKTDTIYSTNTPTEELLIKWVNEKANRRVILILDEFDGAKEILKNYIVEQSTKYHNKFIDIINYIRDNDLKLSTKEFQTFLKNEKLDTAFVELIERAKRLSEKYYTNYDYSLDDDIPLDMDKWLFLDGHLHTGGKISSWLKLKFLKDENLVKISQNGTYAEAGLFLNLFNEIPRFISRNLRINVHKIATIMEKTNFYNKFQSYDNCYYSILDALKLRDRDALDLIRHLTTLPTKRKKKNEPEGESWVSHRDYFSDGFKYYELIQDPEKITRVTLNGLLFIDTPERHLAVWGEHFTVLALSATGLIPSAVHNFALKNDILSSKTSYLPKYVIESQRTYVNELKKHYNIIINGGTPRVKGKVNIHAYESSFNDKELVEKWLKQAPANQSPETIIYNETKKAAFNIIQQSTKTQKKIPSQDKTQLSRICDNLVNALLNHSALNNKDSVIYYITEYLNFFQAVLDFCSRPTQKTMLCLNSKNVKLEDPRWMKSILKDLCNWACNFTSKEQGKSIPIVSSIHVITKDNIVSDESGLILSEVDKAKSLLSKNHSDNVKFFFFASYKNFSVGLDGDYFYEIIDGEPYPPIDIQSGFNPNDKRHSRRDIDAVFFGAITHLFTGTEITTNTKTASNEGIALHRISEIEELYAAGEITFTEKDRALTSSIKSLHSYGPLRNQSGFTHNYLILGQDKELPSLLAKISIMVGQTIGRTNRGFLKSQDISFYIPNSILEKIDYEYFQREDVILSPEMSAVIQLITRKTTFTQTDIIKYNQLNLNSEEQNEKINRIISSFRGNPTAQIMYKQLREILLKFPTGTTNSLLPKPFKVSHFCLTFDRKLTEYKAWEHNNYRYIALDPSCVNPELTSHRRVFNLLKTTFGLKDDATYSKSTRVISYERTCLPQMFTFPGFKEYYQSFGYKADPWEPSNTLLSPAMFNVALGRIGEIFGCYFFKKIGLPELLDINEDQYFELFDYQLGTIDSKSYVDFKNWRYDIFEKTPEEQNLHILKKLNNINGEKAYIINVLKPETEDLAQMQLAKIPSTNQIVIIPWLWDSTNRTFNLTAINTIKKEALNSGKTIQ